jgi:hypothetical protein
MPDSSTVDQMIANPQIGNPTTTMSNLLNLMQGAQAYQTGKIQQAQAQQSLETGALQQQRILYQQQTEQQANKERQIANQIIPKFMQPDGTFDQKGLQNALAQAGVSQTLFDITGKIAETNSKQIEANTRRYGLDIQQQRDVNNTFGDMLNQSKSDVAKRLQMLKDQVPELGPQVDMTMHQLSTIDDNDPQLQTKVNSIVSHAKGIGLSLVEKNTLATPHYESTNIGGKTVFAQTNPSAAGGVVAPWTQGAPSITNTPAPGIVSTPGGPVIYKGGDTKLPNVYNANGVTPTVQDVENFGNYQASLNTRVRAGANVIPQVNQLEQALSSFNDVGGGTSTRANIAKNLQAIGAPQTVVDSVARGSLGEVQAAEKYMFQSLLDTMQSGGAGVTDKRFESASAALPSIDTDPKAKASLLNFVKDRAQRDYAEQQALSTARKNGTFNPATWEADYQNMARTGGVPGLPASQVPVAASSNKTVSMADVQNYATKHNLTLDQAKQHVLSNGFTIK